ncbi:MAG: transcription antitermination factor NusB [Robiginitomaculum sp.]|nr:MAG: transcription antitermination factor NusB [Robiginitomaculum sp.]
MTSKPKKNYKRKAPGKHNARLAAVQALYQMEITDRGANGVIEEFLQERLQPEHLDGSAIDRTFFKNLVETLVQNQANIDQAIRDHLSGGWRLSRVDATLRAILRCGSCELLVLRDTPMAVVIDEYVDIAKSFFDAKESGFVNATLDAIGKNLSQPSTSA